MPQTIETLNSFKAIGGNVYNGTLGIMSLMAPFFIGAALAEERKVDPDGRRAVSRRGIYDRHPL
ncbi:PTS system N,N'-diacetylchitobiose-specific EIIC component [Raoultella terrigena]|uniref:PTS system N,N'-diacetylchitobiose-specific EIIC component n=1 Tax=Raoultella terrigena TaxID=577 RepID=A0A3P8JLV6_RAOTE|nr:PTS system N,N'-diacetylchitobiose-specific EIIC component [Raoultella terrigena]